MKDLSESAVEAGVWKLVAYCEQAGEASYERHEIATLAEIDERIVEQAMACVGSVSGVEAPTLSVEDGRLMVDASFPPHYGNIVMEQFPARLDESRWDTAAWRIAFHMNEFATRAFTEQTLHIVAGQPSKDDFKRALSHLRQTGAIEKGDDTWRWTQDDVDRYGNGREAISLTWSERLSGTFPPVHPEETEE